MFDKKILVFAKAPQPGTVKTRLIPVLGEESTTQLHTAMITNSIAKAVRLQTATVQLWCAPSKRHPVFSELQRRYAVTLHDQVGEDLGRRMYHAFCHALTDCDAAILVGTDCPGLSTALFENAFLELAGGKDVVVAPAEDGGYVLIGMKRAFADLFSGIAWGTEQVYEKTARQLQHLGLSWHALDTQWDVDRPVDLARLRDEHFRYELCPELRLAIADIGK